LVGADAAQEQLLNAPQDSLNFALAFRRFDERERTIA
jgi:hypothetical protein